MDDHTRKVLDRLDHEGASALELAGFYARTLEAAAQRMQCASAGGLPVDAAALRSAALRLEHAASDGVAALVSVVVQSAQLDVLATVRRIIENEKR
ncbi:MAG TPA: hypothetical protein VFK05_12580 [Polyangiaceae bacterium]|nr:hypothetical protein [Polyangiaceae bacterium]